MTTLRIGIVDTGVNPWHSHVRGAVSGCRIRLGRDGAIAEDDDWSDPIGHGTAVAGVLRAALPEAALFAVRVFDGADATYPSLVARGILRAAAARCAFVNLSLGLPPGPGDAVLAAACVAAMASGCVLVASALPDRESWLPAAVPGVFGVSADDSLGSGEIRVLGPRRLAAPGRPRDLAAFERAANFAGPSFACAHGLVHLVREARAAAPRPRARRSAGAVSRSS